MLRVVIADDEINIVEGLKKTVQWEEHDCQVVGTAYDGIAAWDVVCEKEPDILITDITMPGMDGIKLVSKLRPLYPAMRFIYLTCNDDFEMARSAFRTGACDYIVKETMTREELYESIEKAGEEIYKYRENMLNKAVVSNELKILPYSLDYENHRYLMGLVYLFPSFSMEGEGEAANLLRQMVARYSDSYLFRRTEYEYIVMLNAADGEERSTVSGLWGQIRSGLEQERSFAYSYFSIKPCGKNDISGLYERLSQFRLQMFYRKSQLFFQEESRQETSWNQDENHNSFIKKCENAIYEMDAGKAGDWVREFTAKAMELRENPQAVLKSGEQLLVILLHQAMKVKASVPYIMSCIQQKRVYQVCSIYELEELLLTLLIDGIAQIKDSTYTDQDVLLSKALRYIEENLGEHLTLARVASHVSMNSSYFSRYFKGKMNENFVDYLVRCRMERAKQKLRFTGLSVETIASEVGYSNITYFNDSFKKYSGLTPGAFRKQSKEQVKISE